MFVGSVYWLVNLECNDLCNCHVTIFDCNSETVVWDSKDHDDYNVAQEVSYSDFADYEVLSFDLYLDKNNKICLELNIEIDDEN